MIENMRVKFAEKRHVRAEDIYSPQKQTEYNTSVVIGDKGRAHKILMASDVLDMNKTLDIRFGKRVFKSQECDREIVMRGKRFIPIPSPNKGEEMILSGGQRRPEEPINQAKQFKVNSLVKKRFPVLACSLEKEKQLLATFGGDNIGSFNSKKESSHRMNSKTDLLATMPQNTLTLSKSTKRANPMNDEINEVLLLSGTLDKQSKSWEERTGCWLLHPEVDEDD